MRALSRDRASRRAGASRRRAGAGTLGLIIAWLLVASSAACGEPPRVDGGAPDARDGAADAGDAAASWACPPAWVAHALGGCAPAVLACAPDGGAAPGACDGVDLSRPPTTALPDGGTATGFYRLPDGGLGGAWHEPGEDGGPPARDWVPAPFAPTVVDGGPPGDVIPSCRAGWTRQPDGTCDPALRADCSKGAEPVPGATCTATGEVDCPSGEYADESAESGGAVVVHARAGADAASADGSVAHPYPSIAAALARAGAGGWVLVAAGAYTESLAISAAAHVVGVCAARVTLTGAGTDPAVTAAGRGAVADVRGMTLGGAGMGLAAITGARASVRGVRVVRATVCALYASGAGTAVDGADVVLRETRALANGTQGYGAVAQDGAAVTLARAALSDNGERAVLATGAGAAVTLTDVAARGTRSAPSPTDAGHGLSVARGARATATGLLVEDSGEAGIYAIDAGSTATLADVVVRRTRPVGAGVKGDGIIVFNGAQLDATRLLVTDNTEAGLFSWGAGAVLRASDAIVRNTAVSPMSGANGAGALAISGGRIELARVLATGNHFAEVSAQGAGSTLRLADVVLRSAPPARGGARIDGVFALMGASCDATRVLVIGASGEGVGSAAGARVTIADSVVRDSQLPTIGSSGGYGVAAYNGGTLEATRVLTLRVAVFGAESTGPGSIARVRDSVLDEMRASRVGGLGFGAVAFGAGALELERTVVSNSTNCGVGAYERSTVRLSESEIRDTHPSMLGYLGQGLLVSSSTVIADRSAVLASADTGIALYLPAADVALRDVIVAGVAPTMSGFGVGVAAYGGTAGFERLAIVDTHGFALASAVTTARDVTTMPMTAQVTGTDLFVRGVRSSTIRVDPETSMPTGRAVSYGLHTGTACTLSLTQATLVDAELGLYDAAGALSVQRGTIAQMLQAAGATSAVTAPGAVRLEQVSFRGNASDAITPSGDLPEAASLPPPSSPCPPSGC